MYLGIVLTLSRGLRQPSALSDLCEHVSGLELRSVARISALRVCQVSRIFCKPRMCSSLSPTQNACMRSRKTRTGLSFGVGWVWAC